MKKIVSIALSVLFLVSLVFAEIPDYNYDEISNDDYERPMGCVALSESEFDAIYASQEPIELEDYRFVLPSDIDLSDTQFFPNIKDQGDFASCCAFASTYYQFTYEVSKLNGINAKLGNSNCYSPKWTYNYLNEGDYTNGTYVELCYEILKSNGAVKWSEFPYSANVNNTSDYRGWCLNTNYIRNALNTRIQSFDNVSIPSYTSVNTPIITSNTDSDLYNAKYLLATGKVLVVTSWFRPVYRTTSNGEVAIIYDREIIDTDEDPLGHAYTIVGYDDDIYCDLNRDGVAQAYEYGAFKMANSYGSGWGNGGYCWIMYDALNRYSNVSTLNPTNRRAIFSYSIYDLSNVFRYISVKNYDNLLTVEVTLRGTNRSSPMLKKAQSFNTLTNGNYIDTFVYDIGGNYAFDGSAPAYQNATFIFDYDIVANGLPTLSHLNKYFGIKASSSNQTNFSIKKAKLVDDELTVIDQYSNVPVSSPSYTTSIQFDALKLGDLNYSGSVDSTDVAILDSFIVGTITLSGLKQKLADINSDGVIDVTDSTLMNALIS